jgi:hypothetical protein
VFTLRNDKNLQWNYEMECNIGEIGGQIVESRNGDSVIRARIKDEKE